MRDLMNRGRRRRTLPDLTNATVEFVAVMQPNKDRDPTTWVATFRINGWPHNIHFWAKDELDVMKQVYALQRGEKPENVFDVSR